MDTQTPSRSLTERLRARPVLTGGVAVALLALLAVVLFWFEPQALFIDEVVDEAFPTVESEGVDTASDVGDGDTDDVGDAAEAAADEDDGEVADPAAQSDGAGDGESAAAGGDGGAGTTDETSDAGAGTEEGDEAAQPEEPTAPLALATGSFEGRNDYSVTGAATFYELPDGSRTLRLEDFVSDNGPDLYVYLTSSDSADPDAAIDEDIVDLGVLTGNIGNQNYAIPADVDLDRYDTVVIWCLRFTAGFGAADLVAP